MTNGSKTPPAGLNPKQVKSLLDKLETDNEFRTQFEQSPEQAMRSLGYTDSVECLSLKPGAKLASPDAIRAQRAKLESSLVLPHTQVCPLERQEGHSTK
jgi:putative modified peptide